MSFGTFYEVEDEVRSAFAGRVTKSEWYDALGEIGIENYESCEAEESIPAWILALKDERSTLSSLFKGEMRAQANEYDDPDVVFIGKEMTSSIARELENKSKSYFEGLLNGVNCLPDIWLHDPMLIFFKRAAKRNKAIVVMWGG